MPLQKTLYREAFKMLCDCYEAEDAVQNLYLKLWERKEELKNLELNMNAKIQEYEARQKAEAFKKTLTDEMIISVLKQNPDIVQKDFYKLYDPDFKSAISEKLYFMAKEGKIERVKSGSTYILKIK